MSLIAPLKICLQVFNNPPALDVGSIKTNLIGNFSTGSIRHQLLAGIDLGRTHNRFIRDSGGTAAPIDIFNPVYGQPRILPTTRQIDSDTERDSLGIYV